MVIRVVLPSTVEITISWWQSRFTSTPNRERQGLETAGSALIWILACAQRVRGDVSACWYKKSRCGSNGPNVWLLSVKNRHLLNTWLICRNLTNHKKSTVYLVHPSCEKFKIDRCGSIIRRGWNSKNKVFHACVCMAETGIINAACILVKNVSPEGMKMKSSVNSGLSKRLAAALQADAQPSVANAL
jgi:hypothetical protein